MASTQVVEKIADMGSSEEQQEPSTKLSSLHLIRNSSFDPKMLEKMTGIKGWDTDFTSCNIDMSDLLYYSVLGYIQEHFEDVEAEDVPGFNHNFDASYSKASNFDKLYEKKIKEQLAKKKSKLVAQKAREEQRKKAAKEGKNDAKETAKATTTETTSEEGGAGGEKKEAVAEEKKVEKEEAAEEKQEELEEEKKEEEEEEKEEKTEEDLELAKLEKAKEEELAALRKRGVFTYNSFKPGLGMFRFKWEDHVVFALHQSVGHPSGSRLATKRVIVLFIKGRNKRTELQRLIDYIVERRNNISKPLPDTFKIYRYSANTRSWKFSHKAYGRSIESVVLPKETKDALLIDLDDFLSTENKGWYLKHGIPYKRCYLFYGVPGSGKTSLISVIAALHQRTVCYLSPTDSAMSDDNLRHAIQYLPDKAVVVLEDVDALFTRNRETKARNTLTFSGLLNALDGVGSGMGQIFILSTNYRDKLDKALIRNGRVDKHIKFDWIKEPEMAEMFGIFYEDASKEEKLQFGRNLARALDRKKISAATLQHFFITYRKHTKEEALRDVGTEILKIVKTNGNDKGNGVEMSQIYS